MTSRRVVVVIEQTRYFEVVTEVDDLLDLDADELVEWYGRPGLWEHGENRVVGFKGEDDE